ncbi:hypothetical protein D3C86_1753540 [compost metagenome]
MKLPFESFTGKPSEPNCGFILFVGWLLNTTLEPSFHAKPASKNRFRSVNRNLEGIADNFLGPVKGNLSSKLKTAILFPDSWLMSKPLEELFLVL